MAANSDMKIFIGTGAAGVRLKKAIEKIADGKDLSMSKLVVHDFCEKYGYDRKTGKPMGNMSKNRVGHPPRTHSDNPLLNDE